MAKCAKSSILLLVLLIHVPLSLSQTLPARPETGIVKAVSETLGLNADKADNSSSKDTTANTSQTTEHHAEGRTALDDARARADFVQESLILPNNSINSAFGVPVSCSGLCSTLGDDLLAAIEGDACRSLFITGKCSGNCMTEISSVTENESWPACRDACSGDIVSGASNRWVELCKSRQETLIDAGKEAMKTFVKEGLTTQLQHSMFTQFLFGVFILVIGVGYGYRRGSAAHLRYRFQKRRLHNRKSSDDRLPV